MATGSFVEIKAEIKINQWQTGGIQSAKVAPRMEQIGDATRIGCKRALSPCDKAASDVARQSNKDRATLIRLAVRLRTRVVWVQTRFLKGMRQVESRALPPRSSVQQSSRMIANPPTPHRPSRTQPRLSAGEAGLSGRGRAAQHHRASARAARSWDWPFAPLAASHAPTLNC